MLPPSSFTWLNPTNGSTTGAVVPPGYAPGWAGPQAMLFVAFVNESDTVYHGQANPPSLFTPAQPTATWTSNFNNFVNDYNNYWTSFNAVIYPAYEGAASAGSDNNNFLLQAYAATNNVDISTAGLSGAFGGCNGAAGYGYGHY